MGRSGLAILILASSAIAQLDGGTVVRHLKLRLKFANGACDPSAQVQLLGTSGPVANRRPDNQCEVEFVNVPTGTYHVEVSGQDFIQTDEIITAMNGITDFEVEVKRGNGESSSATAGPLVSAGALSIPAKALKEFDKSNDLINHQEYQKVIQSLKHAITIYPGYAAAYNNLGAVYQHLGIERKNATLSRRPSVSTITSLPPI